MKYSKKIILISILISMVFPLFLIPRTVVAQEYTYDGADTEKIPDYSVYPSEWYVMNATTKPGAVYYWAPENYTIFEVVKGNITDTMWSMGKMPLPANGSSVYTNVWVVNATSGEKSIAPMTTPEFQLGWYNASWAYVITYPSIIPIDDSGKVSAQILENVTTFTSFYFADPGITFEHNATYPNKYSFAFWNETNNAYLYANFTDDGILKKLEHTCLNFIWPNMTLMSQPAQEAPDFDITTKDGTLNVNSTEFKLNITVMDADNNNDGDVDTDYLYRIQNGTDWSDWADIPNLLDWALGDVEAGSYTITVEVKNMYGVTQKEITIEYEPLKKKPGIIPSYPIALISMIVLFSISFIIYMYRKKLKL